MLKHKVAIIGTGYIAKSHVAGYKKAGVEVVAAVNPDMEQCLQFTQENYIPHAYQDMDELLDSEKQLDMISICTPNVFHKTEAIKALRAGLNVYLEQPPALNARETKEIIKEAERSSNVLGFAFNSRVRPGCDVLSRKIKDGELGSINSAQAEWTRKKGIPGQGGWFTDKGYSGGGPVFDLINILDVALYMMGYPDPVYVSAVNYSDFINNAKFAKYSTSKPSPSYKIDVESSSHAFITFSNGACLFNHVSWAEMVEREKVALKIEGTRGGAYYIPALHASESDQLRIINESDTKYNKYSTDVPNGRVQMIAEFVKAVDGEHSNLPKAIEIYKLMRIVDAIYQSNELGRPVKMRSSDYDFFV